MTPPVWLQFGVAGLLAMGGVVLVMALSRASLPMLVASIMGIVMIGLFLAERFAGAPPTSKAASVAEQVPPILPAAAPVIVHIHVDAVSPLILGAAGAAGFALAAVLAFLLMRRRDRSGWRAEPVETVKLKPASRALAIRGAAKLPNKFEDWS